MGVDVKVTGGASDCARKATAEECTPLKRKACKQSTYCKWSGKRRGQCSVAANVCDALQVRRKKRKACAAAGTGCMCSKKKKCGKCKMDPPPARRPCCVCSVEGFYCCHSGKLSPLLNLISS